MAIKSKVILDPSQIEYLNQLHLQLSSKFYDQDVNLFNVFKTAVVNNKSSEWIEIQKTLLDFHGTKSPVINYFLDYPIGGYAKMHQDNPNTVVGTAVTLIEKSNNIIGGDTIVRVPNQHGQMIEQLIPQQVGTTLYYDAATDHAVTKVIEGNRKVLITWFRK